jgi:hypothetical protein
MKPKQNFRAKKENGQTDGQTRRFCIEGHSQNLQGSRRDLTTLKSQKHTPLYCELQGDLLLTTNVANQLHSNHG